MWGVVSFYDYAFLEMKHSPLLLVLLLTFGAHKNAYGNEGCNLVQNNKNPFLNEINGTYNFIVSGHIGYNFFKPYPQNYHAVSTLPPLQKNIFNPETGEKLKKTDIVFDPETGEIITSLNENPYFEEDRFTERQLVDLAKKNAQENISVRSGLFLD